MASAPDPATANFDALMAACRLPRLEARALLEQASGRSREWLIAHGDEPAGSLVAQTFTALCERRQAGEPMAYLAGWREFHGRRFQVAPAVLIPRPETETLVDRALELAGQGATVLDLGTGSGCIAVTLVACRDDLQILATDRSPAALDMARANARLHGEPALAAGRLQFALGDWWQAVEPASRFDLVVSNPPYIASLDPHLQAGDLRFEPAGALTDGGDGLGAIRDIVAQARQHLRPGGHLLIEHGYDQQSAVAGLLAAAGLVDIACIHDAAGLPRLAQAKAP